MVTPEESGVVLVDDVESTKRYKGLREVGERLGRRRPSPDVWKRLRDREYHEKVRQDPQLHRELVRRFQAGEPGTGELLTRVNWPLLTSIAKRYQGSCPADHEDRMQQGRMALLEAAARYDEAGGTSPLTWFSHYVKGYVLRDVMDTAFVVRFPCNQYSKHRPVDERRHVNRPVVWTFTDLSDEYTSEMRLSFEDTLVDENPIAEDQLGEAELEEAMPLVAAYLLLCLTEREREVIRKRFYLKEPMTLHDIGVQMGVSRERIRQVEEIALDKLREKAAVFLKVPPIEYASFHSWLVAAVHALRRVVAEDEAA